MKKNTQDSMADVHVSTVEQGSEPEKKERYIDRELQELSQTDNGEEQKQSSSHRKRTCLIIVGVLLLITYFVPVLYFRNRFYGNTYINGVSYGFCSAKESGQRFENSVKQYKLRITGREDMSDFIAGRDTGLTVVPRMNMQQLVKTQSPFLWFVEIFRSHEYVVDYDVIYDEEKLVKLVDGLVFFDRNRQTEPVNAYISEYLPQEGAYEIVQEIPGTILRTEVRERIMEAYRNLETELLLDQEGWYVEPEITRENSELVAELEKRNQMVSSSIILTFGENQECVNGDLIHTWLQEEDSVVRIDQEQVASYVKDLAQKYNTYGKKRTFLTVDGLELKLKSGAFGWKIDQEAEVELLCSQIMDGVREEREPVYSSRGAEYGEINDIGQTYIEINLSKQHLYVFVEGEIVLESDFVSGDVLTDCTTPPGVFAIRGKSTEVTLKGTANNGDSWVTPVHYWMPFNGGIGLHDATWRRNFGGEIYLTNGSHGCINLPKSKAAEIYDIVYKGMPVICYYEGEIPKAPAPVIEENGEEVNE